MEPKENEIQEIRIASPWGSLAVKCWNSPKAKPVILVHGLCDNAGSFDQLIPLLSKKYYYVAVDLPGHGFSSAFPKGVPLEFMNYVGVLQRVVRYFQWDKYSLMGHSFGGWVSVHLAASLPKQVEKLILIDGIAGTPVPRDVFLLYHRVEMEKLLREENSKVVETNFPSYEEALKHIMEHRYSSVKVEGAKSILNRCLKKTTSGYVITNDPRSRFEIRLPIDQEHYLKNVKLIRCPVLVILGSVSEHKGLFAFDHWANTLESLSRTHPMSRVVTATGNHSVHCNNPELVAQFINRFFLEEMSKF